MFEQEKLGIRTQNRFSPYLRWAGLAVAGLIVALGILAFFVPVGNVLIWGGIYGCIVGVIVAIMQSGLNFVNRIFGFLLETYYWRALIYIALSIACFFHVVLIAAGILLDLLAIAYIVVAYFFKEREYFDKATIAQEEERQRQKQALDASTRPPSTLNL